MFLKELTAVGLLFTFACASPDPEPKTAAQAQPGVFTYAPTLNKPHHETTRRTREMSIPGTPLKDTEQWTLDWDAVTTQEGNQYKRTLKLVGMKVSVNGVDELTGDEIKKHPTSVDVLTDKTSQVVDVRGTNELSNAIVALGEASVQPNLRQVFSPNNLKGIAALRSTELHADFIARPTQVGSTWTTTGADGSTRKIRVTGQEACGTLQCLRVERSYDVDRVAVFAEVEGRVADWVEEQGGDPSKVELREMSLALQDSLLIDPMTMDCYGALLVYDATLRVQGPNGELPVAFKMRRETDYTY